MKAITFDNTITHTVLNFNFGIMTKTYAYTVKTDNGGAPCVPDDLLTLGICKPDIRSTAKPGDRLIGISAKTMVDTPNGHEYPRASIIFAAIVDEKLPWENYSSPEYEHRKDCIYAFPEPSGEPYRKEDATVHLEDGDLGHDLREPNPSVLLCRDFRYFGINAIELSTMAPRLEKYVQTSKIQRSYRVFDDEKEKDEEDLIECDDVFEKLWQMPTSHTSPIGGGGNDSQTEDDSVPDGSDDDQYEEEDSEDNEEDDTIQETPQIAQRKRTRSNTAFMMKSPARPGATAKRSCR